jgi:hypothetical protein
MMACYIVTNHYPKWLAVRFNEVEYYDMYDYTYKNSTMAIKH